MTKINKMTKMNNVNNKSGKTAKLVAKLKETLQKATGDVRASLERRVEKLESPRPAKLLATQDVMTRADVQSIIAKEEEILMSFGKITVVDDAISDAIEPMRRYASSKILLLRRLLKSEFRCYRAEHESASGTLLVEFVSSDLDPCVTATQIEINVDRKSRGRILLSRPLPTEIALDESSFVEFVLVDEKEEKRRLGIVEVPCEHFAGESELHELDFQGFNYVAMRIGLRSQEGICRKDARILCLARRGHVLERRRLMEPTRCNVCVDSIALFGAAFCCAACHVTVHSRCINFLFFFCRASTRSPPRPTACVANFNIPHDLATKFAARAAQFCHHCGRAIEAPSRMLRCVSCGYEFHVDCRDFLFRSCGITSELRAQLSSFLNPSRFLSDHLMNVKSIDEFSLIKLVGEGAFSKVVFAVHKETETEVAFKIMHKESLAGCFDEKRVETEKRVLDAVGAFKSPLLNKLLFFYQDASRIFFGLEFCCGGDLLTYFMRNSRVPERQIRQYASEIVIGLCVLHQNRIAYRDLKLDNILLDKTGHIKLCDFGLARTEMDADSTAFTFCGTPDTMAPELFRQTGYRRDVDYWALGVVVYEMFHRRPPFAAPTMRKLAKCVCEHEVKIEAEMSPEARDFVTRLLEKDPMMRLGQGGPDELKRHPWFADVVWDDVIHATNHVYYVPTGAAKIDKSQRINLPFTVAMSGSSGVIDDDIEG